MSFARHLYALIFYLYGLVCHPYATRMHSYVILVSLLCTPMSSLCHSYVLVCNPYVTGMYSYVIRMSLVCTRMSSVCYSYVLVCYPYVTHMWFYCEPFVIPIIKFDKRTIFLFFLLNIMPNSLETVLDVRRFFVRISVTKNDGAVKII